VEEASLDLLSACHGVSFWANVLS